MNGFVLDGPSENATTRCRHQQQQVLLRLSLTRERASGSVTGTNQSVTNDPGNVRFSSREREQISQLSIVRRL
jgi:hypothetical protein